MTDNTENESAVESQDENGDSVSLLREACLAGLAENVEQLLATQEWPREERQEALADAANSGDARCVRLMLQFADIDPNEPSNEEDTGHSALFFAAQAGAAEAVAALLADVRVDPNVKLSDGTTPLMDAIQLSQRDEHDGVVQPNVIQTVRLLARRSDLSLRDEDDLTALMMATVEGREELLPILLLAGSDALFVNVNDESAFDYAVSRGSWAAADFLAEASDPARVAVGFNTAGAARMPGWAARLEATALRDEVQKTMQATSGASSAQSNMTTGSWADSAKRASRL